MGKTERMLEKRLHDGQAALARGAWEEARICFTAALRGRERPEGWEGLGLAAWGLNETALMFNARERAYQLYRQGGDRYGAARLATNLALDHFYYRGEHAVASGWVQRAHRLLEGLEPRPETGWLAVTEALMAGWAEHDFVTVERLCAQAAALGKAHGDLDLEMLALACRGLALVGQGDVAEGMRHLDEATLAAVSGEMMVADAACTACCCLIFACEWVRDFDRAAQWLDKLRTLATRYAHPTQLHFCRTHYAGVLVWQGAWAEAEAELTASVDELEASQPALAAEALVRLADLWCRQGRFEEAARLLDKAETPPFRALAHHFCLLGRAALALAQGDAETAAELAERFLRAVPQEDRLERVAGLELAIQALTACGACERAVRALAELREVAARAATKPLRASVRFAEGALALAGGDGEMARCAFEDAVDLYSRSSAPFEMVLARLELARSLANLGRSRDAEVQARSALDVLHRLGAAPLAAHAEALLHDLGGQGGKPSLEGGLTLRELEVLRLVAAGESNQDIAEKLALSVRTVERHISNIYAKLGLSGAVARAAATDFAHRHGLMLCPPVIGKAKAY